MRRKIEIIEAASEIGAGKRGAGKGPSAVLELLQKRSTTLWSDSRLYKVKNYNDRTAEAYTPFAKHIELLTPALEKVSASIEHSLQNGFFPLVLSGDHSNAIGSVSGFKNYYSHENIGIIWVDAHLDLHSPLTTPSGNLHGMALNALVANDNNKHKKNDPDTNALQMWQKLKHLGSHQISPKLLPENVVYIGVRDYENEEISLARELGIHIFTPADIRKEGMQKCLQKTMELLADCKKIYVSFDVDSLDTTISEGTGTPVAGGLNMDEAALVFKTLFHHEKVAAFEITEINPDLDTDNKMSEAVANLLELTAS